jgi:hypothetical protein
MSLRDSLAVVKAVLVLVVEDLLILIFRYHYSKYFTEILVTTPGVREGSTL